MEDKTMAEKIDMNKDYFKTALADALRKQYNISPDEATEVQIYQAISSVITSYSIHYTKLYEYRKGPPTSR